MASLYVIRGRDNGQHFTLRGPTISIGRDANNHIQLHDTEVSRFHAKIESSSEHGFRVSDLNSSNGTFVNSRRIEGQTLRSGDRLQIGRTLMIFTGGPEPNHTGKPNVDIVGTSQDIQLSHIRRSIPTAMDSTLDLAELEIATENLSSSDSGSVADSKTGVHSSIRTHWEIVYLVGQAISRTVDLDDLLRQVLDLIFQWIACDRVCILMTDEESGGLTPTYSRDRKQAASQSTKLEISRTILDYVLAKKEGVLTSNAQDDARWDRGQSIVNLGVREAICVPMLGRYGLVGAIYVDTTITHGALADRGGKSCFNEDHLKLLIAIASQSAIAVEDTQFYGAMLQSERLATMGQTIANLSHHVKNILQGVKGGSYLIEEGLKKEDFEVVRKGWRIVERNQDRISNMVMDMLSFSKERQPALVEGDLHALLGDVVDLMQVRAKESNVELRWQASQTAGSIAFDPDAMHRAVLNVVTNAIDAAAVRDLGIVEITTDFNVEKKRIAICITDNGEGIAPADRERIFSLFESTKGARGTGLGLPVSRKILREHGGDISVESTPGHGTTFVLYWPMQRARTDSPTLME
jgi:two-component system, NtrC family, sensor kinase